MQSVQTRRIFFFFMEELTPRAHLLPPIDIFITTVQSIDLVSSDFASYVLDITSFDCK